MSSVSIGHEHGTCRELLNQLSDYVDGELEAALCTELEAHLAECPNCQVMVDTVRKTITLYHTQAPAELPSDVEERLYRVLKLQE
jgi:anti-sigma factor (TIGR02949 family)